MLTDEMLKEEIEISDKIANDARYNTRTIKKMFREKLKRISTTKFTYTKRKLFSNLIPYDKGRSISAKRGAAKKNVFIPIKSNPIILQRINSIRK